MSKKILFAVLVILILLVIISQAKKKPTTNSSLPTPEAITFSQPGPLGMFDPSLRADPDGKTLWMSYSSAAADFSISTRLAKSTDNGATWKDEGLVLFQGNVTALPAPANSGIWQYEVSNLVYDQDAPANQKWKVVAFRYLVVGGEHAYGHSWIALKTSASVTSGWSSEKKLFTGSIYDAKNDNSILGAPQIALNQIKDSSENMPLSDCAAFTEPGLLSKPGALYMALGCATGSKNDRIVLLKLSHPSEQWSYVGVLVKNSDAPNGSNGLSAAELVDVAGTDYLLVSPAGKTGYQGCLAYKISSITTAQVDKRIVQTIPDTGSYNNGACSYDSLATKSGIVYLQQYAPADKKPIQIFKSFINLTP